MADLKKAAGELRGRLGDVDGNVGARTWSTLAPAVTSPPAQSEAVGVPGAVSPAEESSPSEEEADEEAPQLLPDPGSATECPFASAGPSPSTAAPEPQANTEPSAREKPIKEVATVSATQRNKDIAKDLAAKQGWRGTEFACLLRLWQRESGWNHRAANRSSGAYGIPQALPGSKMAGSGSDWRTSPTTQIKWGLKYIKIRYGSPCKAWSHSQAHNWY